MAEMLKYMENEEQAFDDHDSRKPAQSISF